MIIQPTSLAAQLWAGAAAGTTASAAAESWRVGTVLAARVLGTNEIGKLLLQIGGMTVEAEPQGTQLPSQFQVRVLANGAQPQLEVIGEAADDRVAMQGLRERLPQQNGYAPLLGTLDALARRPAARLLPAPLRAALATLEASVSTIDEAATPNGLKEAISRSGIFLEAQLARPAGEPVGADFKAALLQLRRALAELPPPSTLRAPTPRTSEAPAQHTDNPVPLRQETPQRMGDIAPPLRQRPLLAQPRLDEASPDTGVDILVGQLRETVRGALARVEIAQLESPPQVGVWMIEVPLRDDRGYDVLQLRIEQEATPVGEWGGTWTVGFALDLPSLGALQGEIQLRDVRTSIRLWAQHAEAVARIEGQFVTLRQWMERAGLQLEQLACHHGIPQPASAYSAVLLEATA
jgi:hypothetical protein